MPQKQPKRGGQNTRKKQNRDHSVAKRRAKKDTPEQPSVYNLVLFQQGGEMLDRDTFASIQDKLDENITTNVDQTEIDVWIESPGGDAHAAFKMYLDLRSRCSKLRAYVPDYAKSAATLFAIGADELFMAAAADLGPLDVQLEHPDREGEIVSSLSGANSLEHLTRLARDLALMSGPLLVQITGLPRAQVLRELLDFTSKSLGPVVSKLDPQLIHEASEALQVTKRYAEIVLKLRINNTLDAREIERIAKAFVTEYPTHGYVIDRGQLAEVGIASKPIEQHILWPQMKSLYKAFSETSKKAIIEVASGPFIKSGGLLK